MSYFTPKHGFVRFTRQYIGGILAGFGLGALTIKFLIRSEGVSIVENPLYYLGAFLFISVGGSLALAEQRRIEAKREEKD